jgi:hypothetical protein
MADCCSNYSKSCPEPVSTVNVSVTNNTFNLDGAGALYRQEVLSPTAAEVGGQVYNATLSSTPFSDQALQIFINGILQEIGDDYVRSDRTITFTFPAGITQAEVDQMNIVASYAAVSIGASDVGDETVGTIKLWANDGATVPLGWLECDGSEVSRSTYAALFAIIGETYGTPTSTSVFVLPPAGVIDTTPGTGTPVPIIKY